MEGFAISNFFSIFFKKKFSHCLKELIPSRKLSIKEVNDDYPKQLLKLITYLIFRKQVERKQKQAMDQHLNFIVDRTEKISALLTESMNVENASSRRTTPNVSDAEMEENDEYEPNEDSDDDERTIGKK